MERETLEIYVTQISKEQQTYYVKLELQNGGTFSGRMSLGDIPLAPSSNSPDGIKNYGVTLFNRLMDGRLAGGFHQAWSSAQANEHGLRIHLWLDSTDPRLHSIPWELMHYDVGGTHSVLIPLAISDQVAFSRYLTSADPWGKPVDHRPIKMCVIISDPDDLGTAWTDLAPINAVEYRDDLSRRLKGMTDSVQIVADFIPDGETRATERTLNTLLDKKYDVLLYFGHALTHPELGTRLLLVEDSPSHLGMLYDTDELVHRMRQSRERRPGLIILIACNTAATLESVRDAQSPTSETLSFSSLAAQLVQEGGVPAVLAMQRLVDMNVARAFTSYLNEQLLRHGQIDVAINAARRSIYEHDSIAWSTPVLYMRMQHGQLFMPDSRQEYARCIINDSRFARWLGDTSDFIEMEVVTLPAGQDWNILLRHPEDAPLAQDGMMALTDAVSRPIRHTPPDARVASFDPSSGPVAPTVSRVHASSSVQTELHNLVSLIGPPHEGQSVMLQCLTAQLAQHIFYYPSEEALQGDTFHQQPVGIFVPLQGYESQPAINQRLERLIVAATSEREPAMGRMLAEMFETSSMVKDTGISRNGQFVFVFDGLDKVSDAYRLDAAQDILSFAEKLPGQHMIVSCTQHVFPDSLARRCRMMLLQPINERIVSRYLQRRNPERSQELFRRIVENQLLELATDPIMLPRIYHRLAEGDQHILTRNEVVLDYLNHALRGIPQPYTQDNAARKTIITLAWYAKWNRKETLPVSDVFAVIAEVRKDRDYDMETLYQIFHSEDLIMYAGQHEIRFVHPLLQAYCAALKLRELPDWENYLEQVLMMCSMPRLRAWWEATVYAFVSLTTDPLPLFVRLANAVHNWGGTYRLMTANALANLPHQMMQQVPIYLLQKLMDGCIMGLDPERETLPDNRASIIVALGRLHYPVSTSYIPDEYERARLFDDIQHHLVRILTLPVRVTPHGVRYDYPKVRIAAARALRTHYAADTQEYDGMRFARMDDSKNGPNDIAHEQIQELLDLWHNNQRVMLRAIVKDTTRSAPERSFAAFALGNIACIEDDEDPLALMDVIMQPEDEDDETDQDTIWSAADALTMFDARQITSLLIKQFTKYIPDRSIEQLAYVAGRVRVYDEAIVMWLIQLLILNTDFNVKAKAFQSLAWIGELQHSDDWIFRVLQSPDMRETMQSLNLDVGQLPQTLLQWIVTNIANWDIGNLLDLGFIQTLGPMDPDETREHERGVLYLRRKAIEAIGWIGDMPMIDALRPYIHTWPLELREVWYATTLLVESRA